MWKYSDGQASGEWCGNLGLGLMGCGEVFGSLREADRRQAPKPAWPWATGPDCEHRECPVPVTPAAPTERPGPANDRVRNDPSICEYKLMPVLHVVIASRTNCTQFRNDVYVFAFFCFCNSKLEIELKYMYQDIEDDGGRLVRSRFIA